MHVRALVFFRPFAPLLLILAPLSAAAGERPSVTIGSEPPALRVSLSSVIHLDYVGFGRGEDELEGAGPQENDFLLKRVRLILEGELYDRARFKMQAGMELEGPSVMDAVIVLPLGSRAELHAGQMKAPFSRERLRPYSHQPFIERSRVDCLALRRTQGIMLAARPVRGLDFHLGVFTGESMNRHNTDDHFEYMTRIALDSRVADPGPARWEIGASAARGRRDPDGGPVESFPGKTLNGLAFFSPVPVSGYRTRYSVDAELAWSFLWVAGQWTVSEEERENVAVPIDVDADGLRDDWFTGDLDPLCQRAWTVYLLMMLTGEPASDWVVPRHKAGALGLALRYSEIVFDSGEGLLPGSAPGVYGLEVSEASEALGRPDIEERVRDLYAGLNWRPAPGVFIQLAAIWQWFDDSHPYGDGRLSDVNCRGRVGLVF